MRIKVDIKTHKKTHSLNVSAKAFISNNCSFNQTEHTYQSQNPETIQKR